MKAKSEKWYVYMLECSDDTLYTGITNDLDKRLHAHNNLKSGAKYTSMRRPVHLVYSEVCEDKIAAIKRELAVKKMGRKGKLELTNT